MATRALVLVIGLRHGYHVARISAPMQEGCRPIPAESGLSVAPAELVELAPLDLLRRRLVGHADRGQVKVRLAAPCGGVDALGAAPARRAGAGGSRLGP